MKTYCGSNSGPMLKKSFKLVCSTSIGVVFLGCYIVTVAEQISNADDRPELDQESRNKAAMRASNAKDAMDPNRLFSDDYTEWTQWGQCSKTCQQTRIRKCRDKHNCAGSWFKDKKTCKDSGKCSRRSFRSFKVLGFRKRDTLMEEILYKMLYRPWTSWTTCSRSCKKKRFRKCFRPPLCGASYIQEERVCRKARSFCRKQYTLSTNVPVDDVVNVELLELKNITSSFIGNSSNSNNGGSSQKESKNLLPQGNMTFTCGVRKRGKGSYRIVGGVEAQPHSWPWQVAILEKNDDQFCGGTLVAPQWVLTAAHCVRKKKRKRKIFVRVGEHDVYESDKGEQKLKLMKDFPHEQYDFATITNDIALLKLERPVVPSETVGFACLPEIADKFPEKSMCYILGWGKEKNNYSFGSRVLREAKVPLVNRRRCQKVFDYAIHDSQICAGYKRGGLDSCAGDSGGPLLCPKEVNGIQTWVVYGVTSYGEGCGQKGKFGIYTKVRKYIDWIKNVISSN